MPIASHFPRRLLEGQEGENLPRWAQKALGKEEVRHNLNKDIESNSVNVEEDRNRQKKWSVVDVTSQYRVYNHPSDSTIEDLIYGSEVSNLTMLDAVKSKDDIVKAGTDESAIEQRDSENSQLRHVYVKGIDNGQQLYGQVKIEASELDKSLLGGIAKQPSTTIKMIDGARVGQESDLELVINPNIKFNDLQNSTRESESPTVRSQIKTVDDRNACKETDSLDFVPHIKMNSGRSSVTESVEEPMKPHLKSVDGRFSTLESTSTEVKRSHIKMNEETNALTETREVVSKRRPMNVFGHISQISRMEFDVPAPRLKRSTAMNVMKESEWSEFSSYQIRPHRRRHVEGQSVDKQTEETVLAGHVKMNKYVNAFTESEPVDVDNLKMERFRALNVHGHASDSSVQALLYGNNSRQLGGIDESELKQRSVIP